MRKNDLGPHPLKNEWLSMAVSDPAQFHATLLLAAIGVTTMSGEDITTKAIVHHNHAIRLINGAIQDERHALKDSTVAAVIALTGYEVRISLNASSYVFVKPGFGVDLNGFLVCELAL